MLQERDRQLLRALALLRVVDREQAKLVAGFHSTTRVNARLLVLTHVGLLVRFAVGTFLGGRKYLYGLSAKGARVIHVAHLAIRWRTGAQLVANLFLEHQLRLNSVLIPVMHAALPPGIRVGTVRAFREPVAPSVFLVPDAYLELETASGIRPLFLEVDLGTETQKVWRKKVDTYLHLAVSGEFTRRFHLAQFRVLVVTTTATRVIALRNVIASRTDKLFFLTTFDSIAQSGIWSGIWVRPTAPGFHSLL